eukprot:COSAG05_NODE_106_length_18750_cov_677.083105_14_plen_637_part_00
MQRGPLDRPEKKAKTDMRAENEALRVENEALRAENEALRARCEALSAGNTDSHREKNMRIAGYTFPMEVGEKPRSPLGDGPSQAMQLPRAIEAYAKDIPHTEANERVELLRDHIGVVYAWQKAAGEDCVQPCDQSLGCETDDQWFAYVVTNFFCNDSVVEFTCIDVRWYALRDGDFSGGHRECCRVHPTAKATFTMSIRDIEECVRDGDAILFGAAAIDAPELPNSASDIYQRTLKLKLACVTAMDNIAHGCLAGQPYSITPTTHTIAAWLAALLDVPQVRESEELALQIVGMAMYDGSELGLLIPEFWKGLVKVGVRQEVVYVDIVERQVGNQERLPGAVFLPAKAAEWLAHICPSLRDGEEAKDRVCIPIYPETQTYCEGSIMAPTAADGNGHTWLAIRPLTYIQCALDPHRRESHWIVRDRAAGTTTFDQPGRFGIIWRNRDLCMTNRMRQRYRRSSFQAAPWPMTNTIKRIGGDVCFLPLMKCLPGILPRSTQPARCLVHCKGGHGNEAGHEFTPYDVPSTYVQFSPYVSVAVRLTFYTALQNGVVFYSQTQCSWRLVEFVGWLHQIYPMWIEVQAFLGQVCRFYRCSLHSCACTYICLSPNPDDALHRRKSRRGTDQQAQAVFDLGWSRQV